MKVSFYRLFTDSLIASNCCNENSPTLVCPRALVSSVVSTATTLFLLASVSAFLYATFYYAYMPVEMVDMPVYLQFQPCEGQTPNR